MQRDWNHTASAGVRGYWIIRGGRNGQFPKCKEVLKVNRILITLFLICTGASNWRMFGWSSGWEQCLGGTLLLEEKRVCIEGLECVPLLSSPVSFCWCSDASPPPSYPFWPVVWGNGAKSCSYGIWVTLLGEAYWLKPPTLARRYSNHLHELFNDRRSW